MKKNLEYQNSLLAKYQMMHKKDKFIGVTKLENGASFEIQKTEPAPVL